MGIIIRQSLKSTIISILGSIIGALIAIIILPKIFTVNEIGNYNFFLRYGIFTAEFMLLASSSTYAVFIKKYESENHTLSGFHKFLLKVPLLLLTGISVVFLIYPRLFYLLFIDKDNQSFIYFFTQFQSLFPILIFTYGLHSLSISILNARHKNTLSSIAKEIVPRIILVIAIVIYSSKNITFENFTYLFFFQYFIGFLFSIVVLYHFRLIPFNRKALIPKEEKKEISKYRYSHFIYAQLYAISTYFTTFIIGKFFNDGSKINASWGIALMISTFLYIPFVKLSESTLSTLSQSLRENNIEKTKSIYKRSSVNLLIIGWLFCFVAILSIKILYHYLGADYELLLYFVPLVALSVVIDVGSGFSGELLMTSNFNRILIYFSSLSLLLLITLSLLLTYFIGVMGLPISVIIWSISNQYYRLRFVKKKFNFYPYTLAFILKFLKFTLPISILFILISYYLQNDFLILLNCLIFTIVYIFGILKLKISDDLDYFFQIILRRLGK